MSGPDGALSAMADGDVWVQMSTVGVDGGYRLGELAAEAGVTFVDAPVLGTRKPAEEGALKILAAGPEDVARALPAGLRRVRLACSRVWARRARAAG